MLWAGAMEQQQGTGGGRGGNHCRAGRQVCTGTEKSPQLSSRSSGPTHKICQRFVLEHLNLLGDEDFIVLHTDVLWLSGFVLGFSAVC